MGYLPNKEDEQEVNAVPEKAVPKEEVKKEVKKEEKHRVVVVKELPTQIVRESVAEDGTILHWMTIEEALTEALNK